LTDKANGVYVFDFYTSTQGGASAAYGHVHIRPFKRVQQRIYDNGPAA